MESDVAEVFLRASDFATEADFTFGDVSRRFNVLFDENYSGHDFYGHEVANSGPVALCQTSDVENGDNEVPGENEDDDSTLEINGTTYNVTKCARAGSTCLLTLTKDPVQ